MDIEKYCIKFILKMRRAYCIMIERVVKKLVDSMYRNGIIALNQYEEYLYVILGDIETGITVVSILLISIKFHKVFPTIIFLFFLFSLRKRTGGYRMDSFAKCYVGSLFLYGITVFVCGLLEKQFTILISITVLACFTILFIGAVNHPNVNMKKEELQDSKSLSRLILLLEVCIISFFMWIGGNKTIITYECFAIIVCALLLCIAKFTGQEVKAI